MIRGKIKKIPWFHNRRFIINNEFFIKGSVIDVGCGYSKYKEIILSFSEVKSYTGLDFYNKSADILTDLNKKLPVENEKYESAICVSVLEHLLEPQAALNEIYRILKPGGYLLLSTPWIYPFHGEPDDHFRYNISALKHMTEKSGFKLIKFQSTGGKLRIFLIFLKRWFPRLARLASLFESIFLKTPGSEISNDSPSYQLVAQK